MIADNPTISVVVPTFERREACEAAVQSALEQTLPPIEVLVCDDGSSDNTKTIFEAWCESEPRLRYLRLNENVGTPGPPRNLGIWSATGEWVAFLDDDDRWLADKLEKQAVSLKSGSWDVVAGNAWRSSGELYFPELDKPLEPSRAEILKDNPVIISSAVVRKSMLLQVGGFSARPRLASIADYCVWMSLADAGARFLIDPEPLVIYASEGNGRLSNPMDEVDIVAQSLIRMARAPRDVDLLRGGFTHVWRLMKILGRSGLERLRIGR